MEYVNIEHGCMKCENNQGVSRGEGRVYILPTKTHGFHDVCVLYTSPDKPESKPEKPAALASVCRDDVTYKYDGQEYVQGQERSESEDGGR